MRTSLLPLFTRRAKNYVNNSEAQYIAIFDVKPEGKVTNQRVFAELKDVSQSGVFEGLKVDLEGNIYSTGPGGVWILSQQANC
ncbi:MULTISPECIES: SMP-30/gluconolactonase/LRE family protein [unclassified Microcoleus]|uniref:SMP-30/gluconolactonase/LRE family protein n=1 Tax=unclassified Microcoleus TaxID=2642155 RepID=UPI0025E9784F|nr:MULTISPECIES: SMP-30/gluconolactonase/LRE family protein [unclassified Microcoleus]